MGLNVSEWLTLNIYSIQELAAPYIASLEATKKAGDLPDSYTNTAGIFYKAAMPQLMMQDLSGSIQRIMYDPATGTFTDTKHPNMYRLGQQRQLKYAAPSIGSEVPL